MKTVASLLYLQQQADVAIMAIDAEMNRRWPIGSRILVAFGKSIRLIVTTTNATNGEIHGRDKEGRGKTYVFGWRQISTEPAPPLASQ